MIGPSIAHYRVMLNLFQKEPVPETGAKTAIFTVLPLREGVLFPRAIVPLNVSRPAYVKALVEMGEGSHAVALSQKDIRVEDPQPEDLHRVGTRVLVHKIVRVSEGAAVAFCEGEERVQVVDFVASDPVLRAQTQAAVEIPPEPGPEMDALQHNVVHIYQRVNAGTPDAPDELQVTAASLPDPAHLADFVASTAPGVTLAERQSLLEQLNVRARLQQAYQFLERELDRIHLREKIHSEAQGRLTQGQREIFLREQLRAIQKELGDLDAGQKDLESFRQKIEASSMPPEISTEVRKELQRLEQTSPYSPEFAGSRNYVDWMVSLPWSTSSGSAVDVSAAERILEEDHFGLEKVKERILDHLAVLQLRPTLKGPILCFVGAPGTGKTSLGKSIARALGRKFARLSLGGVHDEAEIRGHRRTYIGALPGQIIQGIRRAGTNDPVFMLDEIDKLGKDFRGDPASALLEVLDPEQNYAFRDNYLDLPFDLSHTLFITTANQLDSVPDALRDRMEVIELPGYSEREKLMIAIRYLIPRQIRENGLDAAQDIRFEEAAVRQVIRRYTREAGVRNLERNLGTICRKQARAIAGGTRTLLEVTPEVLERFLGAARFHAEEEAALRVRRPGVAVGLAWTPAGGDVIFIEAGRMPGGNKGLIMTGQLGAVMQESVQAALTWVRTNAAALGVDPELFRSSDLHVHIPFGAVPKDGPSAGVTIAAALVSALSGRCLRPGFAMTGEVTLTGLVLPVGAIKEKVLAATRSGVGDVILPAENEVNVKEDLQPEEIRELRFHYVRSMEEIIRLALLPSAGS